jgi:acetyl-CoA acyltransferase 2
MIMTDIYLIEGARTPFGTFGGSLKDVNVTELGAIAAREAIKRSGIITQDVDQTFMGNVIHTSPNSSFLARHVALAAGIPIESPALTVNRLCGSGMQAVVSAAQAMKLGEADCSVAGGSENMSMSPHVMRGLRFQGVKMGSPQFEDILQSTLMDSHCGLGMGDTAENLASRYEISRDTQEEFALLSQRRAYQAQLNGLLGEEIVSVEIRDRRGSRVVDSDEHIKPDSTLEKMKSLSPAFQPNGTVTAATASGINDGSCALVLASYEKVKRAKLQPLARIISWGIAGVDPTIMGIGPVPASQMALSRAGLSVKDLDLVEINEAFAVQYLAVERELGLTRELTNVNGGAIAIGHPVGASGARLLLTLAYELRRRRGRYGLASLCIGGGQGISVIIENVGTEA